MKRFQRAACIEPSGMAQPELGHFAQILDVLDCSGSGDVDTSKVVDAADGEVVGVFGERLVLNPSWVNPSGAA